MGIAKKTNWLVFPLMAIVTLCWFAPVQAKACGTGSKVMKAETEPTATVMGATLEGENFCLGCNLKKEKGAGAQCSLYGHKHSFKVTKALDEDGKELTGLEGWVLHYLENEKSEKLIDGHHKERLVITGKVYPQERILEVATFKKAG